MARADRYTELDNREEMYSDCLTNLNPHPVSGQVLRIVNEHAVTRSIKNLIYTNRGERLFQPRIGSNIRSLLFENITQITATVLHDAIKETIVNHEPRAKLLKIEIIPDPDNNRYVVTIVYMLINKPDPISISVTLERLR